MAAKSQDLFPASPREYYENAPLIQVICQLRFPNLLSIESRPPVEFQERIRGRFPILERAGVGPLPPGVPPEVAKIIQAQTNVARYQFLTEDRSATVTLEAGSLALTHLSYTTWEQYSELLATPLAALTDIYRPNFFSRIGLRYTNAIDRNSLRLDVPWSRLLQTPILGELSLPQFETNLENVLDRTLRLRMPDGCGSVVMRHGIANVQGRAGHCYMIDNDFFTDKKTEVKDAERTLHHFHEHAGRAFRWCITDTLRKALGPRPIG